MSVRAVEKLVRNHFHLKFVVHSPCPSSLKTNSLFSDSFSFFPRRRFFPPLPVNKPKFYSFLRVTLVYKVGLSSILELIKDEHGHNVINKKNKEMGKRWVSFTAANMLARYINPSGKKCQIYAGLKSTQIRKLKQNVTRNLTVDADYHSEWYKIAVVKAGRVGWNQKLARWLSRLAK